MEADPLQWLWNDVDAFRDKINDRRTRTMRNFQRPFDASQHEVDCGRNDLHSRMPCSCCKGSFTFEEVRHSAMTEGFNTAHSMIAVNEKKHTSKRQLVQPMRKCLQWLIRVAPSC
jgi:hypothetical protein